MKIDKKNGNVDVCGIYCISNSTHFYIGYSIHIKKRWQQHRRKLLKGQHENPFMQRVYDKYTNIDPFSTRLFLSAKKKIWDILKRKPSTSLKKNIQLKLQ